MDHIDHQSWFEVFLRMLILRVSSSSFSCDYEILLFTERYVHFLKNLDKMVLFVLRKPINSSQ